MKNIVSFDSIRKVFEKKRYKFFETGDYNLNIGGIRSSNSKSNSFDDLVFIAYKVHGQEILEVFPATTDPGKHWLYNPLNAYGTAIMVPDQYTGAYAIGVHGRSGKFPYKALEQIRPMKYVRDDNVNDILDFSLYKDTRKRHDHIFTANIKSNIHRASKWKVVRFVDRYSAGCQVIQKPKDFDEFMRICNTSTNAYGNSFTYTLLEEEDFNGNS